MSTQVPLTLEDLRGIRTTLLNSPPMDFTGLVPSQGEVAALRHAAALKVYQAANEAVAAAKYGLNGKEKLIDLQAKAAEANARLAALQGPFETPAYTPYEPGPRPQFDQTGLQRPDRVQPRVNPIAAAAAAILAASNPGRAAGVTNSLLGGTVRKAEQDTQDRLADWQTRRQIAEDAYGRQLREYQTREMAARGNNQALNEIEQARVQAANSRKVQEAGPLGELEYASAYESAQPQLTPLQDALAKAQAAAGTAEAGVTQAEKDLQEQRALRSLQQKTIGQLSVEDAKAKNRSALATLNWERREQWSRAEAQRDIDKLKLTNEGRMAVAKLQQSEAWRRAVLDAQTGIQRSRISYDGLIEGATIRAQVEREQGPIAAIEAELKQVRGFREDVAAKKRALEGWKDVQLAGEETEKGIEARRAEYASLASAEETFSTRIAALEKELGEKRSAVPGRSPATTPFSVTAPGVTVRPTRNPGKSVSDVLKNLGIP